jgi:hypothetical protein
MREQMSGHDLHVFTLKFLALKNLFFSLFGVKKNKKKHFIKKRYYATFQCGRYHVKKNNFLAVKN